MAKKKTVKKTAVKTPELTKPQFRILSVLKTGKPMKRSALAEKADVDPTSIGKHCGYLKPEINKRPVHAGNLLNLKFIVLDSADLDGKTIPVFKITATGKKALEGAKK